MEYRLSAILHADSKDYTRLMNDDAEAAIAILNTYRELMTSLIQHQKGRVVDCIGGSLLVEFSSAVNAVQCAVSIQHELRVRNAILPVHRKMEFRIGIDLGEVRVEGESLYGNAVNIAARLQSLVAEGEKICLSGAVYEQIKNQSLALEYIDLGKKELKGIAKPVRVYRVQTAPRTSTPSGVEAQSSTLLIIDDETLWHNALTSLLRDEGFRVVNVFDYSDALHQLQRLSSAPKLAIVDLKLPSSVPQPIYDGIHVLTALRHQGIYAIVLSGHIRDIVGSINGRPEVIDVVDKQRFTDDGFGEYFVAKVRGAVASAEAARKAEGKMPDQQERLRSLLMDRRLQATP